MDKDRHLEIINKSKVVYNKAASSGCGSEAVLWNDQSRQYLRFTEIIKYLDLNSQHKTLLDVGCGNCELYRYLNFMGFRGQYVGYDINDILLEQARKEFGDIDIHNNDIMLEYGNREFDYVVNSGLFNVNAGQSLEWVYEFIKSMFALAREILVFNAISTYVNFRKEEMFYIDPLEVFKFCVENLSRRVTLAHHNLPYNYTIAVYKGEDWGSINKGNIEKSYGNKL